jgi:4-amino-4-deoxy-L-arabinose transferase-like glycosyltransferase
LGGLATLHYITTPQYVSCETAQMSDITMSAYATAALACSLYGFRGGNRCWLILAGLFSGLAGWSKNEGLLFLLCFFVVRVVVDTLSHGLRTAAQRFAAVLLGAALPLGAILLFKFSIAPPSDLLLGSGLDYMSSQLQDSERHVTVLNAMVHSARILIDTLPALGVFAVIAILGIGFNKSNLCEAASYAIVYAFYLCGLYIVYVTTPRPLEWHLHTSLSRVMFELYPAIIIAVFTMIRAPEDLWTARN